MSSASRDRDEDLRGLLEAGGGSPSLEHDAVVLQAARAAAAARARTSQLRVWALAASVTLAVLAGGWLWRADGLRSPGSSTASLNAHRLLFVSAVLSPGLTRGGEDVARLGVPRGVRTVRLRLDLTTVSAQPAYAIQLRTVSGRAVWSAQSVAAHSEVTSRMLELDVPAEFLVQGEYELGLSAAAHTVTPELVFYYFRVARE